MIQRKQSLYLLVGAVAIGIFPFARIIRESEMGPLTPVIIILGIAAAGAAVTAIFFFKGRKTQRKLIIAAQVCTILLLAASFGGLYVAGALYVRDPEGLDLGRLSELVLPLLGYVELLFARRAVTKDIELVQSMDRLR